MYGCELDEDGTTRGYSQDGYDGEDFISLDLNTGTWTAANAKAVITKLKWEGLGKVARERNYLENICIEWLEKYVGYGRATLERKVPPEISLFQKDSSSPVVCHATGFYPKAVMISWQMNGEDLDEGVDLRETVPNQDGTFQKRSILTVSPEELDRNQYTCVVQHAGLEKEIRLQGINSRVLTDVSGGGMVVGVIIGAVSLLLLVLFVSIGLFLWKKKRGMKEERKSGRLPACSEQLWALKTFPDVPLLLEGDSKTVCELCDVPSTPQTKLWQRRTDPSVGAEPSALLRQFPDCEAAAVRQDFSKAYRTSLSYLDLFTGIWQCGDFRVSNRTVMYAHSENASLRITEVNYTDSGLYYCCTQRSDYITFTNSTFLLVQDRDVLLFRNSSRASCSSELFFTPCM
ncbi:hypothetical protein NFI96_007864 [Prochilodus magdalenae]|nr:hypothetical protein NFI96_007864 [Prochilodus magdalenae]